MLTLDQFISLHFKTIPPDIKLLSRFSKPRDFFRITPNPNCSIKLDSKDSKLGKFLSKAGFEKIFSLSLQQSAYPQLCQIFGNIGNRISKFVELLITKKLITKNRINLTLDLADLNIQIFRDFYTDKTRAVFFTFNDLEYMLSFNSGGGFKLFISPPRCTNKQIQFDSSRNEISILHKSSSSATNQQSKTAA